MGAATRGTALMLTSAAVMLACSGDDKEPPPIDFDALLSPPTTDGGGGAAPRPTINIEGWPAVDPGSASPTPVRQAVATLQPIGTNKATGTVRFTATRDGARLKIDLRELAFLSKYTLKVHLFGDCSDDAQAAGPGYNFAGSSLDQPDPQFVMGYLGEIEAEVLGTGKSEHIVPGAAIQGGYSIVGRSVVLHAKPSDPSSDGARLACGVIGVGGDVSR